ncbi:hypothetical protein MPSEU_000205400 [Mayamaea pseudoterrestris]|nr:hypothetical protein MPSEU_000205400 [Mayamaea pseudoterrestris]
MDLLASFHLDALPEQQTRTLDLMARYAEDFNMSLGFDACCACGAELRHQIVTCPACRRVKYCSEVCRQLDANAPSAVKFDGEESEQENALGHTAILCALLKLCNDDEAIEENKVESLDNQRRQSAQDRIQSEFESYPATLANVIAESPSFKDTLKKAASKKSLIVHVIGASMDSEFWDQKQDYASAYAEALAELSGYRGLESIMIFLLGPQCPVEDVNETRSMQFGDKVTGRLAIRSHIGVYDRELLEEHQVPGADLVVFFNPGFTVPDYDWTQTLASIPKGTPFLSTTNTELEGIADCQYLLEQDMIRSIPPGLADIFGMYSAPDEEENKPFSGASYFGVNPFAGMRVRQSGTMANDLYVKNRWMLNGVIDSFEASRADANNNPAKKQRSCNSNSKFSNPALV